MKRLQLDDCRRLFPLVVVPKVRIYAKLFSNICHLESQKTENALNPKKMDSRTMQSQRPNSEIDLAPIPFDKRICLQALKMKQSGLLWQPQVGCFVWDPDEWIKPLSPFPGRIYFILSLHRFIQLFDTIDNIVEKLVWVPTWHQARLICRKLGVADADIEKRRQRHQDLSLVEDFIGVYEIIADTLKQRDRN